MIREGEDGKVLIFQNNRRFGFKLLVEIELQRYVSSKFLKTGFKSKCGAGFSFKFVMRGSSVWLFALMLLLVGWQVQGQVSTVTCKSPSEDSSFCKECRDFYHLYEGQCYINILGCENYVFGNICRKCQKGFILVNNECCDRVCMSKVYNEEHHAAKVAQNKEEELRKAEVDGLEKSIAVVAKNSVKTGQDYDILGTRSQQYQKVFRYFVDLEVEGHQYTATNDYNIATGEVQFVSVVPKGQPVPAEVTLTEQNIHGNTVYEQGYKFVYEKYGLELYELQFSRMSAIEYGRSTELRFVFVGTKVLLVTIMLNQDGPYILWKQERTNVQEVKEYMDNLHKVESITKEYNFKQVLAQILGDKKYKDNEIQVVEVTPVSQEEYIFIIYHRILRIRFRIRGKYSVKTKKVTLDQVEEVFSDKLTEMKEPEQPKIKLIPKEALSKSVEAKEVFDYLYKIQPTFRQNLVETLQVEQGDTVKKVFIITKKDGKDYRLVVLKDQKTQTLQLVDEGYVVDKQPTATILESNQDGTTTVTTSNIDPSKPQVQTLIAALKKNGIDTTVIKLESMQYTEGPKAIEYVAVLADSKGNPTRQVTISQDKQTKEITLIDNRVLEPEVTYMKPVENPSVVIPPSDYFKPEVKDLISKVESKVESQVTITKVIKITVTNSTGAQKYEMLVEDSKGKTMQIAAIQLKGQAGVQVLRVSPYQEAQTIATQTKVVKKVDQFGVRTQYTNDQKTLSESQNVNVAVTALVAQQPELTNYQVISVQTKDYLQQQEQILVLTNGSKSFQVVGHLDQKTLRYVLVEQKEIPLTVTYPVVTQQTVLPGVYPVLVKEYKPLKDSVTTLQEKYKIFMNKVPVLTTVESLQKVEIITFCYEINLKKFIAVVQYDKTGKEDTKIIEVSPIEVTVQPSKVDQTTYEGKTVTTSNSEQEIQQINENTKTVISAVLVDYPLLNKQNITEITLTESDYSDVFEITYTEATTKKETTITVRTDKKGEKVTIEDVWSGDGGASETVKVVDPPKVVMKEEDFKSEPVKKVVEAVNKTKVPVDKITNIVTEKSPNYNTYSIDIQSKNKSYQVTVIDYNQTQEVVSIRSSDQKTTVPITIKPAVVKEVDNKGNQVLKTNDPKYISTMTEVTTVVQHIKTIRKDIASWKVDSVVTINYGTVTGITVTLMGSQPEDALISTVFYQKEKKTMEVVSIQTVVTQLQKPKQVFYGEVVPVTYPTATIPDVAIPFAIKKDKELSSVIKYVQQSNSSYSNVVPVNTEVQQLSQTVIQYTVLIEVKQKIEQLVVIYNSATKESKIVATSEVKAEAKPYYVTEVETETGPAVESNNVDQITQVQPEFPQVLEFSNKWLQTSKDWSQVSYIQVIPSTVEGGSTFYTIETKTTTETKKIEVSYNTITKITTVIDLQVTPIEVKYPSPDPVIKVDPKKDVKEVEEYTQIIEDSSIPSVQVVKEVVSVEKVVTETEETVRIEVLGKDNQHYYITIVKKPDEKPKVVNVEGGTVTKGGEMGTVIESVDSNGNKVKDFTGLEFITKELSTSTTIETVKKTNIKLITYEAVSAKTVDLGSVKKEVTVILKDKQTGDVVQTTSIYDKDTNQADVVSVVPAKTQIGVISATGEEGAVSVSTGQVSEPTKQILVPGYPTKQIPQILVSEAIISDKSLQKVVKTVQDSDVTYKDMVPVSVEVQTYTKQIIKYTVVMEVNNVKKQIVTIYNTTSAIVKPISVTVIPADVKPTYSEQTTSEGGEVVYSSNNLTTLMTKFTDFKFVFQETVKYVPEIDPNQVSVSVMPQDSVNSYTIQTVKGQNKVTIELNYEVVSNRTYVTNYKVEPINVEVPTKSKYYPEVLTVNDKAKYIDTVKNSGIENVKGIINVVESKTTDYALYKETVLKVQTKEDKVYYVKVIKDNNATTSKVVDVTEIPQVLPAVVTKGAEVGEAEEEMGEDQTTVKSDTNGNIVTVSTDEVEIVKNPAVNASMVQIVKEHPEYSGYSIKYVKTVNFGLIEEVMTTMFNPSTGAIDLQTFSFYNKQTRVPRIVAVEAIQQPTIEKPAVYKALYPTVVISDSTLTETIQKDIGLRAVLQTIQKSASYYLTAIPLTVQVQQIGSNTTKYVVILQVAGKKEQKVYTYNLEKKETQHQATTIIQSVVVPKITTQTVVDNKKVTISNSVEQVEKSHPETTQAVAILNKEKPKSIIESVIVVPESNTTTVTLISQSQNKKEYIIEKYSATQKEATKVEGQTVKISDVAIPKPVIYTPVAPIVIMNIPVLEKEVRKIINTDVTQALETTKITSVTVSKNTNLQVYEIKATNAQGKSVNIEIVYNPTTQQTTVVDVSEVKPQKKVTTTTVTKQTSGVSEVTTTNVVTIKASKEYAQISDFVKKNHPDVNFTVVQPVIEQTENYQRSMVKTIILKEETRTIQATYVLDQRTQGIVELSYQILPASKEPIIGLPVKPVDIVYQPAVIPEISKKQKIVVDTLVAINKVDPTLGELTPTYIQVKQYKGFKVITIVYNTPNSDSRILTIYNLETGEAKVIDYTKISKNIEGSKIVESVNELNQKVYYTDALTTTITNGKQYIQVMTVADELVPSIKNKPIKGYETVSKGTGTEYKIVAVENGVISQVVLQFNNQTKEAVLISQTETSVATQISKILKKVEVNPQKLDLTTLQGGDVATLVDKIVAQNPTIFDKAAPIISGSVIQTEYAYIYEITLETKTEIKNTVKITKDKTTNKVTVNDIQAAIVKPALPPVATTTKSDGNGNVETVTNDKKVIKESKEMQKVIDYVYKEKPQLAVMVPTTTKTITYGDITEDTVLFTGEKQTTVQVTTITNKKTQVVTILDSRIIPITYQPIRPAVFAPGQPIYAQPIYPIRPIYIQPMLPIQVIPTPALPIAIKQFPEIKNILASVEASEGKGVKIQEVTVEEFTSVKKYITVTETEKGKSQLVYVFDKGTNEIKLIQTVPISTVIKPVFVETKTNAQGEQVTTSTSVDQVVVKVPEVQTMVEEIKKKYNIDVTTAVKVIEIKGTTAKEIKIVFETEKKTSIVFTGLTNGTKVQVIDVQDIPEIALKPVISVKPVLPGGPQVDATPEIKKSVEEVVFSHPIIKEQYPEATVKYFKYQQTSYVSNYQVTVINKKGETSVIELIQEPGQPIEIVRIEGKPVEVLKTGGETPSTEVMIVPKTGNKVVITTDRQVIKTDTTIRHITQNIYAQLPDLVGSIPIKADSITYGTSKETSIVFSTEGKAQVQVTVIFDISTNKVEIVNTQPIQPDEKPKVQTIPGSIVTIASKKFAELKTMITSIETSMSGSVNLDELKVKDLDQVKIYTSVVYSPAKPQEKTQFVFVYNKGTKEVKQVDKVIVAAEVKAVTYEKKTDKYGETVIQTNDVQMIKIEKPEIKAVLTKISNTYGEITSEQIKTVKITEQKQSTEYQVAIDIKGTTQQVKVVKDNGVITVVGMEQTQTPRSQPTAVEVSAEKRETIESGGQAGNMVTEVIKTSDVASLKGVEIISIKSTETMMTTVYTVQTKTKTNEVQIVTISVAPEGKPQIVQIEPVKDQVKVVIVSESKKEKKVSEVTGDVTTVTTEVKEVDEKSKNYTAEILKSVPQVTTYTPVSVKSTQSGEITWTTIVYSGEQSSIQVTSLYNKTDNTVKVIDKKPLNKTIVTASKNVPDTQVYVIPGVAIAATSKKLTEIATIIKEVSTIYKKSEIESIEIEVFGETERVIAVVQTSTGKVDLEYLVNKKTKEVKLIEAVKVESTTKKDFYSQTTNKYGESTIITNNVTEVTSNIPDVKGGVTYIQQKYPVVVGKEVKIIKVIEYEHEYQVNFVSQVDVENILAIVVSINKDTGDIREISTYTKDDIQAQTGEDISVQIQPIKETFPTDSPAVETVIKYLEKVPDVPIKKIQNITKIEKITTIFGTEVVTIQATTTNNQQIKTVVNYNPITEQVTVNSFDIVSQPTVVKDVVTEFKVDVTTGAKQTVTNNPTVLASSEMMKTITAKVKIIDSKLQTSILTASTTTEYPGTVKVVSIFTDETTKELVQVVSIFNKETSAVEIIEIDQNVATAVPEIPRQIFTAAELPTAEATKPSIPATTVFIQKNYPQYTNQKPTTVIVETLSQVEFVSYIYETVTVKEQIVVVYNKTSKQTKIVQSNPVAINIKPFFYEEKKNQDGENVIVTNNLTEVTQRIPTTEVLTTYLLEKTSVTVQQIQTVELTVSEKYLQYTLVVKSIEGVKQYQYLVDSETKEVKEVDAQMITADVPIAIPKKPVVKVMDPTSDEAKPMMIQIIDNPDNKLSNVNEIRNMTKETVSKGTKYEIEYTNQQNQVNKLVVLEDSDKKAHVIDERLVNKDQTQKTPVIIKDQVDETTKTETTVYPSITAFKLDDSSEEVINYLYKAVSETSEYKIESIRKESFGHVQQYEILLKADKKAPIQVTIAKDSKNKNIVVLEKKKITEDQVQSVLEGSSQPPATVEVSDIEKENIKVLSKLGLVKDIKEYADVSLQQMANNEQFTTAIESVKKAYSALLSTAVIVKILEKKSLESNNVKVFYKAKDQIYEASVEMNEITGQTKLTEFIKIGTQSYSKSEVNVYSDLCYGYQLIQDFSLDSNLDFITSFLKQKHDSLKDASLIEAQEIILQNGRINYKLYYKKDSSTVKYIVYYEPEYKRVLEVKGTSFQIGDKYLSVQKSKQISDPYFRKLDTYIRQNRGTLGAASVMHTESKDDGQKIQFRTVYSSEGKTFRSIASINKDNQNIDETSLSEVIQVPVETSESTSECSTQTAKLDIHDLGKNAYFTECYKYVQETYQKELESGQLLGASEKTNYNIYTYVFYFIIDETKIITLTAEFDPLSQAIIVSSEPSNIDLQEGYYPIRSDLKLTQVRNWLKDNNPDLSSSVLVSSMAKKFYFGTLYKIVFKVTTKYIVYIAYVECGSKEVKIYDSKQLDSYTATPASSVEVGTSFVDPVGGDEGMTVPLGGDEATILPLGGDEGMAVPLGGDSGLQTKLKGFARPTSS